MNADGASVIGSQLALRLDDGAIENADQVLARVAREIALVDRLYGAEDQSVRNFEIKLLAAMASNKLWPSGRILNNAGSKQGQLGSCFVIPVEDDFESIFDCIGVAAKCHRTGGGTGFDFSSLRESGAKIASSQARGASGPIAWIDLFNAATRTVMAGGKTRGANLGTLSVYHPDVLAFIRCKEKVGTLPYFNLSVLIDDAFMKLVEADLDVELVSPLSWQVVNRMPARTLWREIANCAWKTGDPGLLFLDNINRNNRLIECLGPIRATNPCGEHGLYPFEASNLASINLAEFGSPSGIDWGALGDCVALGVRLLDNAIDLSTYPDPRISEMAKANRRIGLGVMGFADLLIRLNVQYDSEEGLEIAEELGSFIADRAWQASSELAKSRGPFPNFDKSSFSDPVRNCAVTSIAPTGTISMIASCSSGIEPRFAANFRKNVIREDGIVYLDNDIIAALTQSGMTESEALEIVGNLANGHAQLPQQIRRIFRYAHDISPTWHVRMLAAWQRHTDNGVSKTINVPRDGTIEEISDAFYLSWKLGCKGISAYREGSRSVDLHEVANINETALTQSKLLSAELL